MGVFEDLKSGFDTVVNGAESFGQQLVQTFKDDAKDLGRVATSLNPSAIILDTATNGGYRKLMDDQFRAIGVNEDDIRDMDYRNHSVLDNARAYGNTLFNVATSVLGAPGISAGIKGATGLGKSGVHLAKSIGPGRKAIKSSVDAGKAFINPKNWATKKTPVNTWKKTLVHERYKPGEWIRTPGPNGPSFMKAAGGEIKSSKLMNVPKFEGKFRTSRINPKFTALKKDATKNFNKARDELRLARIGTIPKNIWKSRQGALTLAPGIEDFSEATYRHNRNRRNSTKKAPPEVLGRDGPRGKQNSNLR